MNSEDKYIGYIKYSGKSIINGLLDARKSGEALLGLDHILRYFVISQDQSLIESEFEIPVKIEEGSWLALIPVAAGSTYAAFFAQKAATDGLLETGPAKDLQKVLKASLVTAQWIIRIAIHLGSFTKKQLKTKIRKTDREIIIDVTNDQGETLSVPKKYFESYALCPEEIFSKNAKLVGKERSLEVGVFEDSRAETILITDEERDIFYVEKDEEILFPDLQHGQFVELEGVITRGNEKTNTIGFEYEGHVLTSKPEEGDIADFKNKIVSQEDGHIFPTVKIIGRVDREDEKGELNEKRPRIIFSDIMPVVPEDIQGKLFKD